MIIFTIQLPQSAVNRPVRLPLERPFFRPAFGVFPVRRARAFSVCLPFAPAAQGETILPQKKSRALAAQPSSLSFAQPPSHFSPGNRGGGASETLPLPPTAAAKTAAGVGKGPFPTVSTARGAIALSPGVWRTLSRRLPAPKACRGARSPRPTPGALPGRRAVFQQNRPCPPAIKFFRLIPLAEAALSHPNLQGREAVRVVSQPLACPSSWARSMQR